MHRRAVISGSTSCMVWVRAAFERPTSGVCPWCYGAGYLPLPSGQFRMRYGTPWSQAGFRLQAGFQAPFWRSRTL